MSKWFVILAMVFLFISSCCHDPNTEDVIPECVLTKYIEKKVGNDQVKLKRYKDYFFLNTFAAGYDGVENIYDIHCNVVCIYCGECYAPCSTSIPAYDSEDWIIIKE